jgi:transcription elongation factor Elf1
MQGGRARGQLVQDDKVKAATVESAAVTCSVCGAEELVQPLTWTTQTGPSDATVACERCTRQHQRAMEAGLDRDQW